MGSAWCKWVAIALAAWLVLGVVLLVVAKLTLH